VNQPGPMPGGLLQSVVKTEFPPTHLGNLRGLEERRRRPAAL